MVNSNEIWRVLCIARMFKNHNYLLHKKKQVVDVSHNFAWFIGVQFYEWINHRGLITHHEEILEKYYDFGDKKTTSADHMHENFFLEWRKNIRNSEMCSANVCDSWRSVRAIAFSVSPPHISRVMSFAFPTTPKLIHTEMKNIRMSWFWFAIHAD